MFRKLHEIRAGKVTVYIDGEPVIAELNDTVAAVLVRQSEIWARSSPISGDRRAPYCMMGVCFECLAEVDGVACVQTCLETVRDGMRIERQTHKRRIGQ